jgi:uncharacterized membrane protein
MIGLAVILLGYLALVVWVCWWAGAEERAEYQRRCANVLATELRADRRDARLGARSAPHQH